MSQHLRALNIIEERSGLQGLIVRPLSAKVLAPTISGNQRLGQKGTDVCHQRP